MRNQQVLNYLEDIHEEYSALYTASILARYEEYTHEPQEVTSLVNDSVFIEEYINTLL